MIEKANTKVIVCFELKIFIVTKKGGKERNFFQSDQDLVELDQSHLLSYICSNKTIPKNNHQQQVATSGQNRLYLYRNKTAISLYFQISNVSKFVGYGVIKRANLRNSRV